MSVVRCRPVDFSRMSRRVWEVLCVYRRVFCKDGRCCGYRECNYIILWGDF
jgi:hypothetical protein